MPIRGKKGWYEYNIPAGTIKIKVGKNVECNKSGRITMKWQRPEDDSWLYHSPDDNFENIFDAIAHITRHTETDKCLFKILSIGN